MPIAPRVGGSLYGVDEWGRRRLRQIVKKLREERIGFDNQTGSLERALKAKERDLEELTLMSNEANHAKDHAKLELLEVDKWLANERVLREKEINIRRDQVTPAAAHTPHRLCSTGRVRALTPRCVRHDR
jgi:hypothetical protein